MAKKFLTIEKVQALEEGFGWLSNYQGPDEGEEHIIGPNINTENVHHTKLLEELGRLNKRRQRIIDELMQKV